MSDEPKGKSDRAAPRSGDRTGVVVGTGVFLLAAIGVGTIFAEPILAALSPAEAPAATAVTTATAAAKATTVANTTMPTPTPPVTHPADGGRP